MKNKILASSLLIALLLASVGVARARVETAGGGVVNVCAPISNLTVKSDPKVGEIGTASVQMGWSVKPCNNTQTVIVVATIINWKTKEVIYADDAAGLGGKITVWVAARQIYDCTITVYDAVTGEMLQTKTLGASTTPKGGV